MIDVDRKAVLPPVKDTLRYQNPSMGKREKPTLMQLRREYNKQHGTAITSADIATRAGINTGTEYGMELGSYVSREDAQRILEAFNTLTGTRYQLEDLNVTLREEPFL